MNQLWWLSFADSDRPVGQQFLGACIVPGSDMIGAVRSAHANRCNPGGEVQGMPIPPLMAPRVPPHRMGVLMNREQAEIFDAELLPMPGAEPVFEGELERCCECKAAIKGQRYGVQFTTSSVVVEIKESFCSDACCDAFAERYTAEQVEGMADETE